MANYWLLNFDSTVKEYTGDPQTLLKYGLERNVWVMQYQFAHDHLIFQGGPKRIGRVTRNWRRIGEVKPGDWCVAYLRGSLAFAIGQVIAPRKPATHSDTIDRTVRERWHKFFDGVVRYGDAQAFYEDFDGFEVRGKNPDSGQMESWKNPQRIDVKQWEYAKKRGEHYEGVRMPHLQDAIEDGVVRDALFRIRKEYFEKVRAMLVQRLR